MSGRPLTDEAGEVRELTVEDFKTARPIAEVEPGLAEAMKAMREDRGEPKILTPLAGPSELAEAIAGAKAEARAAGLTDAEIAAELAVYNAEHRSSPAE